MPVQIPSLDRVSPQPEASVGRIDVKAPNLLPAQEMQTNAVEKLSETTINYMQRQEQFAADTASNAAMVEYHQHLENALQGPDGVKWKKGDPAPLYQKFDESAKEKYDKILESYKNASPATRSAVEAKLRETDQKFYDRKVTAFGNQAAEYEATVKSATLEMKQRDIVDAGTHLDISDPHALAPLETQLAQQENIILTSALKNNLASRDKDGNWILSRPVQQELAKEKSKALSDLIKNLSSSGDVEGAKFIMGHYGEFLDQHTKPQIVEKIKNDSTDQEALQEYDKVRSLPYEVAMNKLGKLTDLEVRKKAEAHLNTYRIQMENAKTAQSKDNYQAAAKVILEREAAGKGFATVDQMLADPEIKKRMQYVDDPKQIAALKHMIDKPEESTLKAQTAHANRIIDGSYEGMDFGTFKQDTVGLSKKEYDQAFKDWTHANKQTNGERRQMYQFMGSKLSQELLAQGLVSKTQFGKFDDETQAYVTNTMADLRAQIDKLPPSMDPVKQGEYVRQYVADLAAKKAFSPTPDVVRKKTSFQGTYNTPPTTQVPTTSTTRAPQSGVDINEIKKQFFRKTKAESPTGTGRFPTDQELKDLIKQGNSQ